HAVSVRASAAASAAWGSLEGIGIASVGEDRGPDYGSWTRKPRQRLRGAPLARAETPCLVFAPRSRRPYLRTSAEDVHELTHRIGVRRTRRPPAGRASLP